MSKSKIEWCDRSDWNPVRGCTRVSPGCGGPGPHGGCYAEAMAARFSDPGAPFHGFSERTSKGPRWTGKVELIESRLLDPLSWRQPAKVFALSMSDLFHEALPDEAIDRVFAVMALAPQHIFQVLTKRSSRMRAYLSDPGVIRRIYELACDLALQNSLDVVLVASAAQEAIAPVGRRVRLGVWPLPHVWLGVSAEDQLRADERVPDLLATPAAVRWVSAEPLLGPIDFTNHCPSGSAHGWSSIWKGNAIGRACLDWIVVGGESGGDARDFVLGHGESIVRQCLAAGVAVFVKQIGARPVNREGERHPISDRKGGIMEEWPLELRVRQMPKVAA